MRWSREFGRIVRGRTLLALLMRRVIPVLVVFMLFVTGVAVMASRRYLTGDAVDAGEWTFWRVVLLTGLAEGACLVAAIVLLLRLYRSITRPLSDMAGEIGAMVSSPETKGYGTVRDYEELVALSEAFDRLFRLQQRRLRESEGLASAVLHDLRTPLTYIHNATELAFRGIRPAMDAVGEIAETCGDMLEVVEMDAEISRTSLGIDGLPSETVDMSWMAAHCLDLYAPVAEAKSVALDYGPPGEPVLVRGRAAQLQRLLSNLLDNAVKYTPANGRVSVTVTTGDARCRIAVSDTGIGILADDLPKIFKRFYRAEASRRESGHGLGLSLVAAIAEAHGGTVRCASTPGRGATFTVELPLETRPPSTSTTPGPCSSAPAASVPDGRRQA